MWKVEVELKKETLDLRAENREIVHKMIHLTSQINCTEHEMKQCDILRAARVTWYGALYLDDTLAWSPCLAPSPSSLSPVYLGTVCLL